MKNALYRKSLIYLDTFCNKINERCVGSEGNRKATDFFNNIISGLGWKTEMPFFNAIDWKSDGAELRTGNHSFSVRSSPYSKGFKGSSVLVKVSNIEELESVQAEGKFLLLHGDIAKEQLMPKNFIFYNPEEHKKIISLLEKKNPAAILCATGRNPSLAGGVYPFPLIEDGDFDIPSVYMTDEEGEKLKSLDGESIFFLESKSERIPGKGCNVISGKGNPYSSRIIITAHIDAKKGTPGAIDNATGVIVLLLLAELLKDYKGPHYIEIVALNGEDYYAVPGQMNYLMSNRENLAKAMININIDGAGYKEGPSAFSFFDLPEKIKLEADKIINEVEGIKEGIQWPQGDHSMFVQSGIPAIAVSSKSFIDNIEKQDITHTPKDNPGIVDCSKLVAIAFAINSLVRRI
jgi:aminopeptidase YwaD